jgi:hypothetical protein
MILSLCWIGDGIFQKYNTLQDLKKRERLLNKIIKTQLKKNNKKEEIDVVSPREIIQIIFFSLKQYGLKVQLFEPKKSIKKNNAVVAIKIQWAGSFFQWKKWWEYVSHLGFPIKIDSLLATFDKNKMLVVTARLNVVCMKHHTQNHSISASTRDMEFIAYLTTKNKVSGWVMFPDGRITEVSVGSIVGSEKMQVIHMDKNRMILVAGKKKIEINYKT